MSHDHQIDLHLETLYRIANALERIATCLEQTPKQAAAPTMDRSWIEYGEWADLHAGA
jgi:hypothetical protein